MSVRSEGAAGALPPSSRQQRKAARPPEVIAAALDLFVERGFAATRLADIAQRCGVSKGTLYLYFESKEDLFRAVVREGLLPRLAEGEALVRDHQGPARELLALLLRRWWALIGSQPIGGLLKLMIAEARNFPAIAQFYHDEVVLRAHRLLSAVLARGQASGEFRTGDEPGLQQVVFAPFMMYAVWRHSLAACDPRPALPEEYMQTAIDFVLRGLAADPAEGRKT